MSDLLKDLYKAASKGFLTSETCGPDGKYLYVCKFRNMDDLNAYEDAWRAAMLAVRDGGSMRQVPEVPLGISLHTSSAIPEWYGDIPRCPRQGASSDYRNRSQPSYADEWRMLDLPKRHAARRPVQLRNHPRAGRGGVA